MIFYFNFFFEHSCGHNVKICVCVCIYVCLSCHFNLCLNDQPNNCWIHFYKKDCFDVMIYNVMPYDVMTYHIMTYD